MKVRAQVSLDNFGCLCVVVLGVAIRWILAARFGAHGFFGGFLTWTFAFAAGLWIAGAAQARSRRLARRAFAAAACPWCGQEVGSEAADAIVLDAEHRAAEVFRQAGQEGICLRHVVRWSGECRACHGRLVFDPEAMTLTPFELER